MTKKAFCIDCGELIDRRAERCNSCGAKERLKNPQNNPAYKDGRTLKIYYCKDCNKIIDYRIALYGTGFCKRCFLKQGKTNYKDGRTLKQYYCKECGDKISRDIGLYGSGTCVSCSRTGNKHWNWQDGKSFEPYPLGWNKTFKEQIRYRDKYICQLCGCHEVECNRKLSIHHIDYDKNNLNPENLTSLCNSCHVKTNHNRENWKNYFKEKLLILERSN